MKKEKISNTEISALGVDNLELLIPFSRVANGLLKHEVMPKEEVIANLKALIDDPIPFAKQVGGKFKNVAEKIIQLRKAGKIARKEVNTVPLLSNRIEFPVFGAEHIEAGALEQMNTAMKLPVTVAGALMPDAHHGYGLPIGGVLATTINSIIPFAVGVDIACRMCLSIFELPSYIIDTERERLKTVLDNNTVFGLGGVTNNHYDTSLFDSPRWGATEVIRSLKDKAYRQLGTSGTGNHFVEWGELVVTEGAIEGVPEGNYLALLSHSGSRGFGGSIANHYS